MEENFSKTFLACPVCSSPERFFESLGEELKKKGWARPEWSFKYDVRQGPVVDQHRAVAIPIGSEFPGFAIQTDVCMNCGVVYATEIARLKAKQEVAPTQLPPIGSRRPRGPLIGNDPRFS